MDKFKSIEVATIFKGYPKSIRQKLMNLRQLILDTASESEDVGPLEETLKWGEPSYLVNGGSIIRIGWKNLTPNQYALLFHCKTKLVRTFKELYGNKLKFEGNRAIVFQRDEEIPIYQVRQCIFLALTYHHRRHLPMLGL